MMSHEEFFASYQVGRTYSVIVHMFGRLTDVWPIEAYLFAFFILLVARNNVVYDICKAIHSTMC
jgi:hypothetical protein